jgi:superfamily II DNA or RNA helicase
MTDFSALTPGTHVSGLAASGPVKILAVEMHGTSAATITWTDEDGRTDRRVIYGDVLAGLRIVEPGRRWAFTADARDFLLASEAQRLRLAYLFDSMLAVHTSAVRPLPHQIRAVYGEMLPRQPLRFLLADDPGAGKTIMAGLLIKELILRGDLQRCLVVAPGSLVEQWQEELDEKFGIRFDILTREAIEASLTGNPFLDGRSGLWIARLDHLSRNEALAERAAQVDWDLVVVDEAHKMSARIWSGEVKRTKRYELGRKLSDEARHFLLMTATPHSGKEEDFQLFMALIDSDRFSDHPRDGSRATNVEDVMRRMVKEELLTFEGRPLFPERRSYTVEYELSDQEALLYEEVTEYVREEMNRAERLAAEGQGRRRTAVGFALTTLQRRLASSPEAIYQSLTRRVRRLESRLAEARLGERVERLRERDIPEDDEDFEDLPDAEREDLEEALVDDVTAAETVAELEAEIATLQALVQRAGAVKASRTDTKWTKFSSLLDDAPEMRDASGARRKLIVFTEHKDTLNYLAERLRTMLGRHEAVETIHGGTRREDRKNAQERFKNDLDSVFLVATDAAGEGVNLQRAHLLVNYDLPWNPNRIEQRFGRVHRIGQEEVCHMWNMVAADTREGDVYRRLLEKLEQERRALGGTDRVYDVLGEVFRNRSLKDLLVEAIRYGNQEDVRGKLFKVVDATISDGLKEVLAEQALHREMMSLADVEEIRLRMERVEANRLQPHYIQAFFDEAFGRFGGRTAQREPGRYEIKNVPLRIRDRDRAIASVGAPVVKSYERVTFETDKVRVANAPPAALLCPGYPLFDAVLDLTLEHYKSLLTTGAVLVNDTDDSTEPYVLVYLEHEVEDGRPAPSGGGHVVISRRMQFVVLTETGEPHALAGAPPYLDCRPATETERALAAPILESPWLVGDAVERIAISHAIDTVVAEHFDEVRAEVQARVDRTEQHVVERLNHEIRYWDRRANDLRDQEAAGKQPRMNAEAAQRRADELAARKDRRLAELQRERQVAPRPPRVTGASLVLPAGFLREHSEEDGEGVAAQVARETKRIERLAVDAVLAVEKRVGHKAKEMPPNNPGYDIESFDGDHLDFIEVKGRVADADSFHITRTEVFTSLNKKQRSILALVRVHDDDRTEVRYLRQPFGVEHAPPPDVGAYVVDWQPFWDRAEPV